MMVDIKLNWKYLKSNCVKPGSISKEQREKYLKEPEMEAIRLIRLDYRIGLQNARLVYEQLKK